MEKFTKALFLSTFAFILLIGCTGKDGVSSRGKTITIKGSDTMVILGQRWAETYMHHHPGVTVQVTGGGTGTGIAALINGGTDICAASRPLKQKEREQAQKRRGKEVKELAVALDGVVIFFNEDNPLTELSLEQLESIYRGQITDWSALGRASGKIICYGRENSSGTYMYFKEHVLNGKDFATDVQSLPGTAAVINAVLKDKNAIGYGGIGYVKGVKTVPISAKAGVQSELPTLENVVKGSYPLSRQLYFYMLGEPTDELKDFLAWALCDEGQKVCETVGYYPVPKTHE